jgi:hypothetical protein
MSKQNQMKLGVALAVWASLLLLAEIFMPYSELGHDLLGYAVSIAGFYFTYLAFRYGIGMLSGTEKPTSLAIAIAYLPQVGFDPGVRYQKLLDLGAVLFFIVFAVTVIDLIKNGSTRPS